jgi:hypothetical protein
MRRLAAVGASAAIAGAFALVSQEIPLRFLSVLAPVALVVGMGLSVRRADLRPGALPHLVLWAFVVGCLARIPLSAMPQHYGFFLLPVPILAAAVALTDYLPWLARRSSWSHLAGQISAVGLLCGCAVGCFRVSSAMYERHRFALETPHGSLLLASEGFETAVVRLLERFPPETRILTIPHGAGFTFFSGLRGADATFSYLPLDLHGRNDDAGLVRRWSAAPPDLVCLLDWDMSEYGYQGFGRDYGQVAMAWLHENYAPITDPRGLLVVMGRRR